MPLEEGKSQEVISRNIATEMHHGKEQPQAVAIAMRQAGVPKPHDTLTPPIMTHGAEDGPLELKIAHLGDEGVGTTALPGEALMPGLPAGEGRGTSDETPQIPSGEAAAIGHEMLKVHEHLHKHEHEHHHKHRHEHVGGESPFGSKTETPNFGYEDAAAPACHEVISHDSMRDAVRQMWESNEHDPENANGIVTPR